MMINNNSSSQRTSGGTCLRSPGITDKMELKIDLLHSHPSVSSHNRDTFHEQCDGSCYAPGFTLGDADVNTGVGRRGSHDPDVLLAPPSDHRIVCRGIFPGDLRGRVTLSPTIKVDILSWVNLLGVTFQVKHGAICE